MSLLLLVVPQLDLESDFYLETRQTYLIPRYVCFSNDYRLLLLKA